MPICNLQCIFYKDGKGCTKKRQIKEVNRSFYQTQTEFVPVRKPCKSFKNQEEMKIENDITKCHGKKCPIKKFCYRFTSSSDFWQSWFVKEYDNKKEDCPHYWPNREYTEKDKKQTEGIIKEK